MNIIDPFTNDKVSVETKKGQSILKNYIKNYFSGGVIPEPPPLPPAQRVQAPILKRVKSNDKTVGFRCETEIQHLNDSIYNRDDGSRTIVMGDIHGDIEALRFCLKYAANVIDDSDNWIGGSTFVVLAGDMIDRARRKNRIMMSVMDEDGRGVGEIKHEELKIQRLLNKLALQSNEQNGRIIKLMGNHEIMLLNQKTPGLKKPSDSWSSKYSTNFGLINEKGNKTNVTRALGNKLGFQGYKYNKADLIEAGKNRTKNYAPAKSGANLLMNCGGKRMIVKVGDWIIVHGGIRMGLVIHTLRGLGIQLNDPNRGKIFLEKANETLRQRFNDPNFLNEIYKSFTDRYGLVWNRKFSSSGFLERYCHDLLDVLKYMGFPNSRLVLAHCNQMNLGLFKKGKTYILPKKGETANSEIYGPIVHSREEIRCNYRDLVHSNLNCPVIPGITYQCPDADRIGKLWRIDVAMSRGFDLMNDIQKIFMKGHIDDYWEARKPQVLEIIHHNRIPDEVRVLKSKHHLPRNEAMLKKYIDNQSVRDLNLYDPRKGTWDDLKPK